MKETLWARGKRLDVIPYSPVYSPVTQKCVFIGKLEGKGGRFTRSSVGRPILLGGWNRENSTT